VLFVCLGNICRSPTAEAVLRHLVSTEAPGVEVAIASAGLGDWHVGEPPDRRTQAAALRRGFDMSRQRARHFADEDFARFDLILAMDRENLEELRRRAPPEARRRVRLFLEFAAEAGTDEVPDPYYGGQSGFERVLDLAESGARGLLDFLRRRPRD